MPWELHFRHYVYGALLRVGNYVPNLRWTWTLALWGVATDRPRLAGARWRGRSAAQAAVAMRAMPTTRPLAQATKSQACTEVRAFNAGLAVKNTGNSRSMGRGQRWAQETTLATTSKSKWCSRPGIRLQVKVAMSETGLGSKIVGRQAGGLIEIRHKGRCLRHSRRVQSTLAHDLAGMGWPQQ